MIVSDLGYVLHTHPFQDNKTIAVVLTQQQGMQRIVFQTARRQKKHFNFKSCLQPFQPLWVSWKGYGELKTGKQVETSGLRHSLAGRLLYCGFYLNELLIRLLPAEETVVTLFELYQLTLTSLVEEPQQVEIHLRQFEFTLLAELGYEVIFDVDIDGAPINSKDYYAFIPNQGFCLQHKLSSVLSKTAYLFSGEDLIAFTNQQWSSQVKKAIKGIARLAFAPHLGSKPLTSRMLFIKQT